MLLHLTCTQHSLLKSASARSFGRQKEKERKEERKREREEKKSERERERTKERNGGLKRECIVLAIINLKLLGKPDRIQNLMSEGTNFQHIHILL